MDTFVSHAEDDEEDEDRGAERRMGSEKALEMISTKDSSFIRCLVRSFVSFVCSFVCLLASGLCVRTREQDMVFRFPFRFSAYFIITIMTK